MKGIVIPLEFIDKYVRFTKPEYLQVYLYVAGCGASEKGAPDSKKIAAALDMEKSKVDFIIEYWESREEFIKVGDGYAVKDSDKAKKVSRKRLARSTKPSYSQEEIKTVSANHKDIAMMLDQAEAILKKPLTPSYVEMLFSFNDWLGLPPEVILMLVAYAEKNSKVSKNYMEATAIDWAENGINTYEAAEARISELEKFSKAEKKICSVLGIYDRGLTQTEKKYITSWANDGIPLKLISLAYDKTVENTGKLKFSYMNSILQSWAESGFTTPEQIKEAEEKYYRENGTERPYSKSGKSKFNNYEDANKKDYSDLEEQILDMMLDND